MVASFVWSCVVGFVVGFVPVFVVLVFGVMVMFDLLVKRAMGETHDRYKFHSK